MPDLAIDRILDALRAQGGPVRESAQTRGRYIARCPAHDDRQPSLSLKAIDGAALVRCHAGCATEDIMASLEMSMRDLFDNQRGADYRYTDRTGKTTRTVHRTPDKQFPQSGPKTRVELFQLPAVIHGGERPARPST